MAQNYQKPYEDAPCNSSVTSIPTVQHIRIGAKFEPTNWPYWCPFNSHFGNWRQEIWDCSIYQERYSHRSGWTTSDFQKGSIWARFIRRSSYASRIWSRINWTLSNIHVICKATASPPLMRLHTLIAGVSYCRYLTSPSTHRTDRLNF